MPGWWFTVESTTTKHLHRQFKKSIEDALASKTDVRAMMRARSAKQRFPVAKWVEDLNSIQSAAIKVHQEENAPSVQKLRLSSSKLRLSLPFLAFSSDRISTYEAGPNSSDDVLPPPTHEEPPHGLNRTLSLGVRNGPGHRPGHRGSVIDLGRNEPIDEIDESNEENRFWGVPGEYSISQEDAEAAIRQDRINDALRDLEGRRESDPLTGPRKSYGALIQTRGRRISRTSQPPSLVLTRDRSGSFDIRPSPPLSSRERSGSVTPLGSRTGPPEPRVRSGESFLSANTSSGFRSSSVLGTYIFVTLLSTYSHLDDNLLTIF
jgi:alpha-1,3-glucan synthase